MEMQVIPIKHTILKSFEMVKKNSFDLIRLGAPLIFVTLLSTFYYQSVETKQDNSTLTLENMLIGAVYLFTLANAVIGAHRIFLLPSQDILNTKAIRWTMRETRFTAWWFAISLCAGLIAIPLSFIVLPLTLSLTNELIQNKSITYIFSMFITLPVGYLFCRWALIFPATAIDQKNKSLEWSWKLSKGHSLRLFILIGGIPLITNIMLSLLPNSESIFIDIIYQIIWLVVGVVEVCLLSLCYQILSDWHSENTLVSTEL